MACSGYKRIGLRLGTGLCSASALLVGSLLYAQENTGADRYRFSVSQSLRATDNIRLNEESAGTTYAADTALGFEYRFGNELQSLDLSALALARVQDDPVLGSESGLSDADFTLSYLRDGANARLQLQSQYLRTDLGFDDPLEEDELTEEDLSSSLGRRININNSLGFETGLQSPLGLQINVSQRERRYQDTTDPDLFDTETTTVSLSTPLRLSETTQARLNYVDSRYEAEDVAGTSRDSRRWSLGLEHAFSPITRVSFDLGHSEVDESFTSQPDSRNSGTIGSITATRDLPNGEISAQLDTSISQAGRQRSFSIARQFELPDGELRFSFGATDGRGTNLRPIGSVVLRKERESSSLTVALSRSATPSDTDALLTETTRLNVNYDLELTALSSLSLGLRYADIADLNSGAGESDRRRASVNVALNRQVTEDWDLVTGYQFRHARRNTGSSGESNAVYFTLKRDFGALN